jgi:hypothetical protein
MNKLLVRIFLALLLHVAFLALVIALLMYLGGNEDAVSDVVRARLADDPTQIDAIRGDAVWQLVQWSIYALGIGWLISGLWLAAAERQKPCTPSEGAGKQALWVVLLFVALGALAVTCWVTVFKRDVEVDLTSSMLTYAMLIVSAATLLAYFVATAICVKSTMRPSVPFSEFLPSLARPNQ